MGAKREVYDIFVGAETGLLKGVNVSDEKWQNVTSLDKISREKEITALCWHNSQQTEVCVGRRDCSIDVYSQSEENIVVSYSDTGGHGDNTGGRGNLKALATCNSSFITCTDKGHLRVTDGHTEQLSLEAGEHIYCMAQHPVDQHRVATGGKENDLKIWDLQQPTEPVFKAKNVRNDWLNLRVPVWVTDAAFFPDNDKIVTCTGHHQVRVYDPSSSMRRPVLDVEVDEYPIMSMALRSGYNQVLVGNTQGLMALVDLRGKGHVVQKYKGFAGGIRSIQCHPEHNVVVSCGLDRYLRVHDINSKLLLNKFYLKSRLNQVLLADKWHSQSDSVLMDTSQSAVEKVGQDGSGDQDGEELWDSMGVVKIKPVKQTEKTELDMEHSEQSGSDQEDSAEEEEESEEETHQKKKQKRDVSHKHEGKKKRQKTRHK